MKINCKFMFKKLLFCLIIVSFTAYPTVPVLAQELSGTQSDQSQTINENQNTNVNLTSPDFSGDFLLPDTDQAPIVDPVKEPIQEDPAGKAPSQEISDAAPIPEEPPVTDDDPPVTPHQYSDGVNGTVEKSKFNKANGEMQVDSFSGAVTYSYTFDLPPGRSGLQPNLGLNYNSQLKNFSNLTGLGWELPIIDVHRDFKKGNTLNPENGNHNYLVFNYYGNNQPIFPKTLVDDYHGEYITNNSDFSKIEYKTDDSWEIIDKNGTKYFLGTTVDYRLQKPGSTIDPRYINKWLIKEIQDTNDNFISFEYYKDNNQIYPKIITYTGHGTTDGTLQIRFQPFADQTPTDRTDINTSYEYRIDDVVLTKYLINRVDILVNGELKKKYQLSYSAGDNETTALLTSIQEIGVANGQDLERPATSFEYTVKERTFVNTSQWNAPSFIKTQFASGGNQGGNLDFGARIVDINGDGLADVIRSNNLENWGNDLAGVNSDAAYINNGLTGWYEDPSYILPSSVRLIGYNIDDQGSRLVDLNGDSLTDIIRSYLQAGQTSPIYTSLINNGDGTWAGGGYQMPFLIYDGNNNGSQNFDFADINGDGYTDIIGVKYGDEFVIHTYLNNGLDNWIDANNQWQVPNSPLPQYKDSGRRIADVNGDGLPDILFNSATYLNTGNGWFYTGNWSAPAPFVDIINDNSYDLGTRLADVNGDGFIDIVRSHSDTNSGNVNEIYLNNGVDRFNLISNWQLPNYFIDDPSNVDTGARLIDVNSDNLVDFVIARYEGQNDSYQQTWLNEPALPNILKKVDNGYQKIDEFNYRTQTKYINGESVDSINYTSDSNYVDSQNASLVQTGIFKVGTYFNSERYRTYYHFDLSAVPPGEEVVSFKLDLNINNNIEDIKVYKVDSEWSASSLTWNNQPVIGEELCQRPDLISGSWTFYCHGPIDGNGIVLRATPDEATAHYTDIINAGMGSLVYQTADPYNPNQDLNSTVEVVDEIHSNDGINLEDSVNNYEYSNGAKATSTSNQTMPLDINQQQLTQPGYIQFGSQTIPKIAQGFKVSRTGDYGYVKFRTARNNANNQYLRVAFYSAGWDQSHQLYYPANEITHYDIPASEIGIFGGGLQEMEVHFPTPAHLMVDERYFLVLEGDGNGLYYSGNTGDSSSYTCTDSSPFFFCDKYFYFNDPVPPWNFWYNQSGDLYFAIGIDSYTVTRQNYEFSGFGKVEATDQDNNKNITYFHQGGGLDGSAIGEFEDSYAKRGKPFRTENYDSNGYLLSQTINKWNSNDTFINPDFAATSTFVYLDQSTNSIFNNSAEHKDTATTYTYDYDNGNILTERNEGEVEANISTGEFNPNLNTGDEKLTTYEYATSAEALHILGAPKNKVISDPNSISQVHQDYYYDNLPLGQVEHLNVTKEDLPSQNINTRFTYNDYGLVTQKKDPYDNTTTITYDQNNLYPETTTNALNQTVETTYDLATGQLLESIDPNGLVTQNDYDALGRLTEVKTSDPLYPTQLITRETYEYHDFVSQGEPWWIKHSVYATTTGNPIDDYSYFDGFGRVVQERKQTATSNQFSVTSYQYDDRGNLEKQSLPYFENDPSYVTPNWSAVPKNEYTYDGLNRVLTVVNSLGTTSNSYDLWKTTVTDANNKSKNIYHDAHNRLIKVDEILNSTTYPTTYTYNYLDKLTNITDSQNNLRNFVYDDLGRLTSQEEMHIPSSQNFGVWEYEYDLNSNLTQKIDPKSQVVNYTYDDLNRKLTEDYTGQTGIEATFVYDLGQYGIGRLSSTTASQIITSYEYDILGRIAKEIRRYPTLSKTYTTQYTYDLLDNPLKITYPDSFYTQYGYNSVGQTNQVIIKNLSQSEQTIISNITYTPLGQMDDISYTNGTTINNTYDPDELYRLTSKISATSTSPFQNIIYTYDAVGNITDIIDSSPNQLAKSSHFVYDDLYRLTTADITDDYQSTTLNLTFNYDPIGNITNKSDVGSYLYNNSNPYQTNSVNNRSYVYDNNGNLTNDQQRTMAYDFDDRMSTLTKGATTTLYYYDTGKTRVAKFDQSNHVYKVYPNKYQEEDRNGERSKYVFLGDLRLLTVTGTSTPIINYNFGDHLNSSAVTTNSNGNITNLNDYLPYGSDRVSIQNGLFNPSYKYIDQESDNESGIYYYDARYYNQQIGRFIQVDPKVLENSADLINDPQNLNYYAYSRNNPIRYVDPNGETYTDAIKSWAVNTVTSIASSLYNQINSSLNLSDHPILGTINMLNTANQTRTDAINAWGELSSDLMKNPGKTISEISQGTQIGLNEFLDKSDNDKGSAIGKLTGSAMEVATLGKVSQGLANGKMAQTLKGAEKGTQFGKFNVDIEKYPGTGGGGFNVRNSSIQAPRGQQRIFSIDYHPFELKSPSKLKELFPNSKLHFHWGEGSDIKLHRPYETPAYIE